MRTMIMLSIILLCLAHVTEQASVGKREGPRSRSFQRLLINSQDNDDFFLNNLLEDISSNGRPESASELKGKRTESTKSPDLTRLRELTDFPFKDKISGPCLASIVRQICHNVFPGLREGKFPTYDTTRGDEGEFFCNASDCKIENLQAKYCKPLQHDFSNPRTLPGGEKMFSHSSNNNVDPSCARYITEETYKEVRREGWRCERDLRCICRDCVPIPRGKHHHHHHHYHHNRQENNLSPLAKVLLAGLHRSQMPVAKKVMLEKLLQESVNELIPKHHMFQNSTAIRVTNPERNFPLQG